MKNMIDNQEKVLNALKDAGKPMRPGEIAEATELDTKEVSKVLKKLNLLILKLNSMRSGSINFDVPQQYLDPLTERMSSKTDSSKTDAGDQ